jgi:hypothetical protein
MTDDARDIDAWERAIQMMRDSREAAWANNVDRMLKDHGLEETGKWAAHNAQFVSLRSAPWLTLPSDLHLYDLDAVLAAGDDERGEYSAAVLLKRMRNAGVSDWDPNPLAALREAEKAA